MRILLLDFIKKRPWLDLDNGELCGILKKYEIIVEWITQADQQRAYAALNECGFDFAIIHVEHQGIRQALELLPLLKKIEKRIIIFGYAVNFHEKLKGLTNSIPGDNIDGVIRVLNKLTSAKPHICRNVLKGSDFSPLPIKSIFNYPIRYSKGCENFCPYCEKSLELGKEYRQADEFEAELKYAIEHYSIHSLSFMDSSLLGGNGNHFLQDILPILKKYRIPWRSNGVTLTSLHESIIPELKQSGCYLLSIGIEHYDPTVCVGKHVDKLALEKMVNCLHQNGICSIGFYLTGLQNDTFEKSLYSLEQIKKSVIDIKIFASAVALPGTRLWEYVKENGRFLCGIEDDYPDHKQGIQFETPEYPRADKEIFIRLTEQLRLHSQETVERLTRELGGPWSVSVKGNIQWKE